MRRVEGWRGRLTAYLAASAGWPFEWGRHDCALFAADCIQAMTGDDPAADFRGRYRSFKGGLKVLRKAGHADHVALATALLDEVAPAFAQAGDLAMIATPDGAAMGIVQGHRVYVLRPEGLATVDLLQAARAWRVPA
jgi:hypothetical protein